MSHSRFTTTTEDTFKSNRILVLSSTNYEKWFALTKAKLQAKGGNYVLDRTKVQHLQLHPDDRAEYDKLDGLAKELILLGTDEVDLTRIIDKATAKEQWDALVEKYKDNRKLVVANKQKEFVNYEKKPEQTVQDTWSALHKIRNDIVAIKPSLATAYDTEEILYRLYDSLPPEYATTVAVLKSQEEKDDIRALRILQEMEDSLKDTYTDTGMYARRPQNIRQRSAPQSQSRLNRSPEPQRPQRSSSKSSSRPASILIKPRCYICDEEGHKVQECDAFEAIKELVRALKDGKKKTKKVSFAKKKPHKAYEAESDSSDDIADVDSSDEEEIAHITKEAASKLQPSSWITDTGASSHMTDKTNLFSGPLTRMKRRTIKVGGGELYADQMGTIVIKSRQGRPVHIMRVYYVPGLGANLLSCRRLCMLGLKGRFDTNAIFLQKRHQDMLRADHREGVYVLTWISSKFPTGTTLKGPVQQQVFPAMEHPITVEVEEQPTNEKKADDDVIMTETEGESQPSQSAKDYFLMHRRFAHFGSKILTKLHEVTTHSPPIRLPKHRKPCPTCAIGKMKKRINRIVTPRKDGVLDLVSIDACGPLPKSLVGNTTFLEIVDNHSRKVWTICTKDRKSIPAELDIWKNTVELQTGRKLKAVRLDNAPELLSLVKDWVKKHGLTLQDTEPYTSHQNGIAERAIQTTEANVRAMLQDAQLPMQFWDEAAMADAYLRNRIASGPIIDEKPTSPEQVYTGKLPSIDHVRVWGCKCISYVNPNSHPVGTRRDKLMPKGREAVLMGFDPETIKQYRVYAPDLGRCIKASTITFFEDEKGGDIDLKLKISTPNELATRNPVGRPRASSKESTARVSDKRRDEHDHEIPATPVISLPGSEAIRKEGVVPPDGEDSQISPVINGDQRPVTTVQGSIFQDLAKRVRETKSSPSADTDISIVQTSRPSPNLPRPMVVVPQRKSTSASQNTHTASVSWLPALKRKRDDEMGEDERITKHIKALLAMKAIEIENEQIMGPIPLPASYEEAINDPIYGRHWLQAAKNEISQLEGNNTYVAEVPPEGANIVTCKWVFAVKYNQDDTVQKFKARLVARGFSQMHGIDYDETFAPTIRMDTLRAVLALVAIKDLETGQIDVNNAFTESTLKHLIYMSAPPGLDVKQGEYLRLLQSLYGLKQAAHDWYFTCNGELIKLGFVSSESDPCMYINKSRELIVLVYVDDISIVSPSKQQIEWFKKQFAKAFKIKDLGELKKLLGIEIERDRATRTIRLSQTTYIKKVLEGLDMGEDRHRGKPDIPLNGYDYISPASPEEEHIDRIDYSRVVGKLMHMMVYTRPDIAFALGKLSQYMSNPAARHGHGIRALLRYLRSNSDMSITYSGKDNDAQLVGYSDADYAADKSDRKSTMGQVFMLGNGPISWSSRKQRSVSTSTTEAEYMALSECSRQAVWLINLFTELGYPEIVNPTHKQMNVNTSDNSEVMMELKGDNNGAIALVKNRQVSERSKHIDVAYHYIRDLQKHGKINVNYIPTDEMRADGFTKPLAKQKFQRFLELIGMKANNRGEQALTEYPPTEALATQLLQK